MIAGFHNWEEALSTAQWWGSVRGCRMRVFRDKHSLTWAVAFTLGEPL